MNAADLVLSTSPPKAGGARPERRRACSVRFPFGACGFGGPAGPCAAGAERRDRCTVLVCFSALRFARSVRRPSRSRGLRWALSPSLRHPRSLASELMTIPELAGRIDQRVAALQQEIDRLEATKRALAQSSGRRAGTKQSSAPPSARRRGRRAQTPSGAVRKPARTPAPNQRRPKPASTRSLFRELDAGLRTRS